jgi:hypothetical protein
VKAKLIELGILGAERQREEPAAHARIEVARMQ